MVKTNGQWVCLNAYSFSEGMAKVGKIDFIDPYNEDPYYIYGFINTKGETVLDYQFSYAGDYKNGVANISKDREDYCIDPEGNKVESQ